MSNTEYAKLSNDTIIELTNFDSEKTVKKTFAECKEMFGKAEFREVLDGYLPNWAAVIL